MAADSNDTTKKDEAALGERTATPAPGGGEGAPASSDGGEPIVEIVKEGTESGEALTAAEEQVQKRTRRTSRRELLDLIHKKNDTLSKLDTELTKTKQELRNREDRYLRLAAEFENYRKRTRREWELHQNQANADLIREIVGGIDNFDRAFAVLGETDMQVTDGLRLIYSGLMDILRKAGLAEIDALHQKFDPAIHEAVGEVETDDVDEGHVAQIVRRGYRLHDAVLRPARVIVSRKREQTGSS